MERIENILPIIIMIEMILASIPLFINGKYGSAIYWLTAGILNFAVIFMIKRFG